jgi:predicted nucleic acid-binding Zn ribbon protein
MRAIAMKVIEGTECDTIISILHEEIAVRDSLISAQDKIISAKDSEITLGKTMLEDSDQMVANLEEDFGTEVKKHKRTKIKWYVSLALTVIIMTLITK